MRNKEGIKKQIKKSRCPVFQGQRDFLWESRKIYRFLKSGKEIDFPKMKLSKRVP